jgi:hypothetical protein
MPSSDASISSFISLTIRFIPSVMPSTHSQLCAQAENGFSFSNYLLPPLIAGKCIQVEMGQGELERYERDAVLVRGSCVLVGQRF